MNFRTLCTLAISTLTLSVFAVNTLPLECSAAGAATKAAAKPSIALFRDPEIGGQEIADAAKQALDDAHLTYEVISASSICDPATLNRARFKLLIYTGGRTYPNGATTTIDSFLKAGGALMCLGGPPLTQAAWQLGSKWVTQADLPGMVKSLPGKHLLFGFEEDKEGRSWTRGSNSKAPSKVYLEEAGSPSGKSLTLDVKGLIGWDTFGRPIRGVPEGHDLLCFYARGDERTNQTSVELREKDGSRWIATVNIGRDWGYHVLRLADFKFWEDGSAKGRGGVGDRVTLSQVNQMHLGLSFTHTMVGEGDHKVWLDEISTAKNPLPDASDDGPLTIDALTPEYKLYPVKSPGAVGASPGQAILPKADYSIPADGFSCSPRPQGTGYLKGRFARFVPLLSFLDAGGRRQGYAAWMVLNGDGGPGPYPTAAWAVFGSGDSAWYQSPAVRDAVGRVASRLVQGLWLYEGGSQFYTYFRDEASAKMGTRVVAPSDAGSDVSVRIRVRGRSGRVAFERGFWVRPGTEQDLSGEWHPGGFPDGDYTVTTELLKGGSLVDSLVHPLVAWSPRAPGERRFVSARDGGFWFDGKPWYAHGVNYMPASGIALDDGEAFEYWLEGRAYDPDVVEEDLARIRSLGMNSVSVFIYSRSAAAMNLLDFLVRCERHGLKVNLSIRPHANPLDFSPSEVEDVVQVYRLAANDTVFAYDLAWERSWGFYEPSYTNTAGRKGYDADWQEWVVSRYGSLASAEEDWGYPVPKTADGEVTGPSDAMLRGNGKWTTLVAAYRRFVDDFVGKKHSDAARFIRSLDPNHLISFRMSGDAGDPTADPASFGYDFRGLAKSMDIMEPEGYGRLGNWDRVRDGAFTAAYARYAAPGRPLLWAEFGKHAWTGSNFGGAEEALAGQGSFVEDFYRMTTMSQADGTSMWWYPGGFRVGENSDYGLMNPDGSARPATLAARSWAPIVVTKQTPRKPVDLWIEIDRDADARGLFGVYEKAKGGFWKAMEDGKTPGLRDAGMGTDSTNTPMLSVGNTEYNGTNPPKYLNAEFNLVEVLGASGAWVEVHPGATIRVAPGKPVVIRASIGNTQVASWVAPQNAEAKPGGVYLGVRQAPAGAIPISHDTAYLGDARAEGQLTAGVAKATPVTLQMVALDRMWFGETLSFTLSPK